MKPRYLDAAIRDDLDRRMVFLGGPRQVGKTTLAREIGATMAPMTYLNWDSPEHRRQILRQQWPQGRSCLVFDEIHKDAGPALLR